MKNIISLVSLALLQATAVYSQVSDFPQCALQCFTSAIASSGCGDFDYYCQCTTGAKKISHQVIPCLCKTSTCQPAQLLQVEKASDGICSSALSVKGQTYTPTPVPTNACALYATAGTSASTSSAAASGSAASAASASSSSSSTSNFAAAPTHMGLSGAMLGMAGMAVVAL